ncbi:MAG: rRNA pseudouridine synthase [Firmicutes bacterium]|nr:rRNA pseudouridine synthase [Bacillota bacterium]
MERLQKVIAASGYTSRRKAEELILNGKVTVNGKKVYELGTKVDTKDEIKIDGNVISREDKEYYLLYKPRGVITSTSDDKARKTVTDLINTKKRIYPVGRLDYDTTGVLLLTNDGEFTNIITHPSKKIDKVYVAKVKGIVNYMDIKKLCNGVYIDGVKTSKAKAKIKKYDKEKQTTIVELIIHEGKNHQVKKMFESLGYEVVKLKREKVAFFDLKGLKPGEYRSLTPKEVKIIYGEYKND